MPRLTNSNKYVGVALCGLFVCVFGLWQINSSRPLRLKIERNAVEQGRQVVIFRVVGAEGKRIEIADVRLLQDTYQDGRFERPALSYLIPQGATEAPFHTFDNQKPRGVDFHEMDVWAPTSEFLLMDPEKARHEFALLAPTNGFPWKVRVAVNVETAGFGTRLNGLVHDWTFYRETGCSMEKAARLAWRSFHQFETQVIESSPVDSRG